MNNTQNGRTTFLVFENNIIRFSKQVMNNKVLTHISVVSLSSYLFMQMKILTEIHAGATHGNHTLQQWFANGCNATAKISKGICWELTISDLQKEYCAIIILIICKLYATHSLYQ